MWHKTWIPVTTYMMLITTSNHHISLVNHFWGGIQHSIVSPFWSLQPFWMLFPRPTALWYGEGSLVRWGSCKQHLGSLPIAGCFYVKPSTPFSCNTVVVEVWESNSMESTSRVPTWILRCFPSSGPAVGPGFRYQPPAHGQDLEAVTLMHELSCNHVASCHLSTNLGHAKRSVSTLF